MEAAGPTTYMHPHMITLTGGLSIKTSLLPTSILPQAPSPPQRPDGTRVLYVRQGEGTEVKDRSLSASQVLGFEACLFLVLQHQGPISQLRKRPRALGPGT